MSTFTYDEEHFLLNGKPLRILSGAMHYFRIPAADWDDRLAKLRAMGLNTVETYVPWNLHEPQPGQFDFSGNLDIVRYIQAAARHGLYVIVRPGPYICGEWELGGLPAWLLKDPGMRLRCSYPPYLEAVARFFDALLPYLVPFQITHEGPLLAMQIENEYGSYGNDQNYLRYLEESLQARGIDVMLFTSDGPTEEWLQGGILPHLLKTVNFGSRAVKSFTTLRNYQAKGPLMCMEFWNGWFDHWGESHHTRETEDAVATLEEILAAGASVSFYMFHGGTNFGFMSGANLINGVYQPTTTSYDYDAPLDEAGNPTSKYYRYRVALNAYTDVPELPEFAYAAAQRLGPIVVDEQIPLFAALEQLAQPRTSATPEPMEYFDQDYGFILYRTTVSGPRPAAPLIIRGLHDRAQVFVNGVLAGTLERSIPDASLTLSVPPEGLTLDILVENMGRINYGPDMVDRKGIADGVVLGQQYLYNWTVYPLPLDNVEELRFQSRDQQLQQTEPTFYRARFQVEHLDHTYLALPDWVKGVCWINGFNLGRYWQRPPQRTLFVPGSLLHVGTNELIIFELHQAGASIEFRSRPEFI